ncbi:phage baseplate protein [uncultured Shewanella sp.]|uniref:phage baseplate protein n=1 Tax=uncultured Shewanella sp. TaxID=173975 RepID=UPI002637FF5F|nr:phage baseplate protein [uncultured Shewanella sp.]
MIGIDRATGQQLEGFEQFVSRVIQVMTTPLTGRAKRAGFGSRVRELLGANMSPSTLVKVQSFAIEAFYNSDNGLNDFIPSRCVAKRRAAGLDLYFEGQWQGRHVNFEVPIDVSTSKSLT